MKKYLLILPLLAMSLFANAGLMFVGSWNVYDRYAPYWSHVTVGYTGPLAYTGQEAAAFIFGGNASDYSISTVDNSIANINNMAWYDVIGWGGGQFAENYSNKYLGEFYGPTWGFQFGNGNNPASSFIRDNLERYHNTTNFAFHTAAAPIPVPGSLLIILPGLLALFGMHNRKRGDGSQF
jgi:hypothetical protein